jgi:hypothetical protein
MAMNGFKINQHFPFQGLRKDKQMGIFGLKINHLATLIVTAGWKFFFCQDGLILADLLPTSHLTFYFYKSFLPTIS